VVIALYIEIIKIKIMENSILNHEKILVKEIDKDFNFKGGFGLPEKPSTHVILFINDKGVEEFVKFTRLDNPEISKYDEEYVRNFLKRRGYES
jgi:hypothetical protein